MPGTSQCLVSGPVPCPAPGPSPQKSLLLPGRTKRLRAAVTGRGRRQKHGAAGEPSRPPDLYTSLSAPGHGHPRAHPVLGPRHPPHAPPGAAPSPSPSDPAASPAFISASPKRCRFHGHGAKPAFTNSQQAANQATPFPAHFFHADIIRQRENNLRLCRLAKEGARRPFIPWRLAVNCSSQAISQH